MQNTKIAGYLAALSQKRYDHTMAVVRLSAELAVRYNICVEDAKMAATLHDITKEYNFDKQLQILNNSDIINENTAHSITARIIAENEIEIKNSDVLNAIEFHTTGRAGMSMLEKIIYVADACAYDRVYDDAVRIRKLAFDDIDRAIIEVITYTLNVLLKKNRRIDVKTVQCYNDILRHLGN